MSIYILMYVYAESKMCLNILSCFVPTTSWCCFYLDLMINIQNIDSNVLFVKAADR